MKNRDKQAGIMQFLAERKGKLDTESLGECYRLFVDPGFVAKASHALHVCCPDRAQGYVHECFQTKPNKEQLYAVRNAINHGDIDPDSLQEMYRVEEKLERLKMIVLTMLGRLIPFSYPLDSGPHS